VNIIWHFRVVTTVIQAGHLFVLKTIMANAKLAPKSKWNPTPARLFMILARKSPTAVIFRRGPSHWVQLIKWNTETDTFELGQWFHGKMYERRADLSPDGSLLIYFAQKISQCTLKDQEFRHSWTAISKPPYFTAPALWPKGQSWDGGGLFKNDKTVLLSRKRGCRSTPESHAGTTSRDLERLSLRRG